MPWRRASVMTTARSIAIAVDTKAGYVPGHSDGVAYLIGLIAREAGYAEPVIRVLYLAALLHDAGKLSVPDSILLSKRSLTIEEYEIIKQHSVRGERIALALEGADQVAPWIRHVHERFDGRGYPDGLAGEEIPWPSRMLAVADAFHVITTDRSYQQPRSRSDAMHILKKCSGTQFDPVAVELLGLREGELEHPRTLPNWPTDDSMLGGILAS